MDYAVVERTPSPEVFRRLRAASGLSDKTPEAAAAGLANTWHAAVVLHGDEPVGMGRVVGDGGTAFLIVDVCVLPEHQGAGLGRRIVAALTRALEERAPESAYVSIIADGDSRHLYAKYGFREVAPASVGMARRF